MATIQKIFNKHSTSYKVLIRNKGLKPIIKTFKKKHLAISFIDKFEGDDDLIFRSEIEIARSFDFKNNG